MGLDLLGREEKWRAIIAGICHTLGAMIGGAFLGGLLGWLGSFIHMQNWRIWIIVVLGVLALWQSLLRPDIKLGRQCQVNRRWHRCIPVEVGYFLWGIQLGCGLVTFIPSSCFIVLLGAQLSSGPLVALLSGACFGMARESVVLPVCLRQNNNDVSPTRLMSLLPRSARLAHWLNIAWLLIGVSLLIFSEWH